VPNKLDMCTGERVLEVFLPEGEGRNRDTDGDYECTQEWISISSLTVSGGSLRLKAMLIHHCLSEHGTDVGISIRWPIMEEMSAGNWRKSTWMKMPI
jgi:hypothetical protein